MMSRRFAAALLAAAVIAHTAQARAQEIEVLKSETCGCCNLWVEHLRQHGFTVKPRNMSLGELDDVKARAGLKRELQSCHTGMVGGYVVEGHVPAAEVQRLLKERPDAIGLSVPGMPLGSPGMEVGDRREPYEVLLVKRDGTTETFARY